MTGPRPFQILAVCTGNVCRSPMVERLLHHGFEGISPGGFLVRSAGTHALVGQGMTPQIAGLVRALGASDTDFAARQLTPDILQGQDLVLAVSRQHRSQILELVPSLLRKTFTLREFARMTDFIGTSADGAGGGSLSVYDRWEQLIPMASAVRHEIIATQVEDNVVDPYRRDDAVHQQMVEEIIPAIQSLLSFESKAIGVRGRRMNRGGINGTLGER